MPRPLDQIADWADIHGVTPDIMNYMLKLQISTRNASYTIPDELFSEQYYVDQMKFRKPYITKLHALLTRLLPGSLITIRLTKINNGIRASSEADGAAQYAAMLAGLTPAQREAEGKNLVDSRKIIIDIQFPGSWPRYTFMNVSILNPSREGPREGPQWSDVYNGYRNEKVGLPVNNIVFDAILKMRDDAVAKIAESVPIMQEMYYRPPGTYGPGNVGGKGYLKTAEATTYRQAVAPAGGSRKRRRRRRQTQRQRQRR
jgi:hypothetical protein